MTTEKKTGYWRKTRGEFIKPEERQLLYDLACQVSRLFDRPHIVNIGVSWGASVHCLHAGASKTAIMTAIDTDYSSRPLLWPEFLVDPSVDFIMAKSGEVTIDGPIHLVFVDGDHSYDGLVDDIENWVPRIVPGGMIAFHDYSPANYRDVKRLAGVRQAIDEWYSQQKITDWLQVGITNSTIYFRKGND